MFLRRLKAFLLLSLISCLSWPAIASEPTGYDKLVKRVASETGVPREILVKVCTHETRSFWKGKAQPWPWAVNVSGESFYYKNFRMAHAKALSVLDSGRTNIDIGICQLNWRWHGHNFTALSDMFHPYKNMVYAANLLVTLKGNSTWEDAIGRYHSPFNTERAERYKSLVLAQ